jgi:hypothetical protein
MKKWLTSKNVGPYQKLHESIGGYVDMKPASMEENLETSPFGKYDADPRTAGTQEETGFSRADGLVSQDIMYMFIDHAKDIAQDLVSDGFEIDEVKEYLKSKIDNEL